MKLYMTESLSYFYIPNYLDTQIPNSIALPTYLYYP